MQARLLTALLLLPLAAATAQAQQAATGSIVGRVGDAERAPLPGVSVTLTSGQGERATVTGADGRFAVRYLTPGRYDLHAELSGYELYSRHGLELRVGQQLDLEITMTAGSFTDQVEVAAATPIVDYSTAGAGTVLDSGFLAAVPVGRHFSDALYLASGVTSGGASGRENPSVAGASGLENLYFVDGVGINDPRYGGLGVFSSDYGSFGTGISNEFVGEIQVRTAGAEAEYGQSTGGVVNVVTKSGSNRWTGALFGYSAPGSLAGGRRQVDLVNNGANTTAVHSSETGFSLGGPVVHDRAFLFVAFDPQWQTTSFRAPDGFPLSSLGDVDRDRRVLPYDAKLTANLSESQRLDVSAFGDPGSGPIGPQSAAVMTNTTTAAFSQVSFGSSNQSVRYQGVLRESWLVEALVGRFRGRYDERPSVDAWQVTDQTTRPSIVSGGRGGFDPGSEGVDYSYQLKSTHLWGGHEVKWGATLDSDWYNNYPSYTGPPVTLPDGQETSGGVQLSIVSDPVLGKVYRVTRARLGDRRASNARYIASFVQDRYQVGKRLTLSAGVRFEDQHLSGDRSSLSLDNNWAPRLGVVYDPSGNGTVKLSATAGVYYAKTPNSVAITSLTSNVRVLRADYYDPALTQPIPNGVLAGGVTAHLLYSGSVPVEALPGTKPTYLREGTLGIDVQAAPELALGLHYQYRDLQAAIEDVGQAAYVLFFNGSQSAVNYVFANPGPGNPATEGGIGAQEKPIRRYDAVELSVDRRLADRWSLRGSYRWSRLAGTYEGYVSNDTNQANPGLTAFYDFPSNDPSYTAIGVPQYGFRGDVRYNGRLGEGPLPTDRTHDLKAYATYAVAWGVNLGAGLSARSGIPLTPRAADPVTNRVGGIAEAPRGAGILTVDGFRRRTPWESSLDLHGDVPVAVGSGRLVVALDVFNVLDTQAVTGYDQNTQRAFKLSDPDFGKRISYQDPRTVRVGVRLEF
jgi:hypothetical protein